MRVDCRWCGARPKLVRHRGLTDDLNLLRCSNVKCPVRPETSEIFGGTDDDMVCIANEWNRTNREVLTKRTKNNDD